MKSKNEHIAPEMMIEAIDRGNVRFEEHLRICPECSAMFKLLKGDENKSELIVKPNVESIERFSLIPFLSQIDSKLKTKFGTLSFDSWSRLSAVQTRELEPGLMRHIRFTAGDIKIEIVAERQQYLWDFTAKVYLLDKAVINWIMVAGNRRLLPGRFGFYQWCSNRKPQSIRIYNDKTKINLERLSWA